MPRVALVSLVALTLALLTGPAFAFQCPKLISELSDATSIRYDPAAAAAKEKAAQASKLHGEGKHEESVKAAQDGLAMLGVKK
jgi:hypothetical protein